MAFTLDKFDLRILDILQKDAGQSVAEIGAQVKLSQNACWRRINQLREQGFIRSTVALLNGELLESGLTVFVSIRTTEHSEKWLQEFATAVRKIKEVVEFHRMSGDVDYLLKVRVKDIHAYDAVYKRLISQVRITDVSSAFSMEEIKYTTCIPLPSA
jgi:Lrp/AsnC family transcriptional regulator, cysteine-sensing transcriptional activator